jgi:FKBP-type peptidyl-prolyl cis-trans isomerase FkpA
MRTVVLLAMGLGLFGLRAWGQTPEEEKEKALYVLGVAVGRSLEPFQLSPAELEIVRRGLTDVVTGARLKAEPAEHAPRLHALLREREARVAEARKRELATLVERAAREPGAKILPSGAVYQELRAGKGASPQEKDTVEVYYRGTLPDGTEFDSSEKSNEGEPSRLSLDTLVRCWKEALPGMKVGGKARLTCPPASAYGEQGVPPSIPPNATLLFELELVGFTSAQ